MKLRPLISLTGLGILLGLFFVSALNAVTFESLESITETGAPVFNKIKFLPGWNKDIWIMKQSHHGFHLDPLKWDRLAIVVDKTKSPKVARFYQLSPSEEMEFKDKNEVQPFKARCFACHSNGPRAIRMKINSAVVRPNLLDRATVALWNLRIKTYGPVDSFEGRHFYEGAPFRSPLPIAAQPLNLKSCTHCHRQNGIRNPLVFEQIGTAHFLVKNGFMPPFPFSLSVKDRRFIEQLTK